MQPAARKLSFRQDLPLLFLAWLVPAALMMLFAARQARPDGLFPINSHPELSPFGGALSVLAPAQAVFGHIWPLLLLFTFIVGVACCSLQMIGKRGMLVSLAYCTVSLTVLAQFAPGTGALGALQLVLLISLLAFCLCSRHAAELAIGAGLCSTAMLATGLDMMPFVVVATIWFAIEWAFTGEEPGDNSSQKTVYFGYSFAIGTVVLGLTASPGWNLSSTVCGPLSLIHLLPAVLAGIGLAHLATSTVEFSKPGQRMCGLGFLVIIVCCGVVAANPNCVLPTLAGLLTGTATWPWGQGLGAQSGLLALLARDPLSVYTLCATPVIGVFACGYAALGRRPSRSAWMLVSACLLLSSLLMMFETKFAIYANALAILPCAWLTLAAGQINRTKAPTLLGGALFLMVWLAGMNAIHSLIGTHVVGPALAHQNRALPCVELTSFPAAVTGPSRGLEGTQRCR